MGDAITDECLSRIKNRIKGLSIKDIMGLAPELLPDSETPLIDVEVLLLFCLKKARAFLYTYPEKTLMHDESCLLSHYLVRRFRGVPIAYITQEQEFWSLSLKVNESVLIPRPETELIVELALRELTLQAQNVDWQLPRILDVGTGSGAIALALAATCPDAEVSAVDVSDDALVVAQSNAEQLNLEKVSFFKSDLLSDIPMRTAYHLIVSNPPYIDRRDPHLAIGDVRFEPQIALVADNKGFQLIERLILESKQRLLSYGMLIIEHGHEQGEIVRELFQLAGFEGVQTETDLAGLERVTSGRWQV